MSEISELARQLIGCLIGDRDRTIEQHYIITEDSIPSDLKVERAFLRAIYTCREESIPPTPANIERLLKVKRWIDNPEQHMKEIIQNRSTDPEEIKSLSVFIHEWQVEQDAQRVSDEIKDIMSRGSMDYEQRYNLCLAKLNSVSPKMQEIIRYSNEQLFSVFKDSMRAFYASKQSGMELGIALPYEGHKAFFSRMQWREMSSILAETGHGKTMFGLDIAEYNAWHRKTFCDSLVILLETDPERVQARQFSKHSLIPYAKIQSGEINPDSPLYAEKMAQFEERVSYTNNKLGMIHFVYIPDARVEDIVLEMERHAVVSKAANRDLYIVVDYLQKIGYWNYPSMKEHQVYQMFAERVAATNRKLNTHTTMIAQYNAATGEAYGSSRLRTGSQLSMLIERDEPVGGCAEDLQVFDKDGKTPLKDAMGNVRYRHRKGDELSSTAKMTFVKANDGPLGHIKLNLESAFGRIEQDQKQLKELKSRGML